MNNSHELTFSTSTLSKIAICSCGWRQSMPRRNALAVKAKLKTAHRRHIEHEEIKRVVSPELMK